MYRESIRSFVKIISKNAETFNILQSKTQPFNYNQIRNVVILRRKYPVKLVNNWIAAPLEEKHSIYEVIQNSVTMKKALLKLILIQPVEGIGQPGEVVEVHPYFGRDQLLLPGAAVYASPENLKKYENLVNNPNIDVPSSPFVYKTMKTLEATVFTVIMNLENPWKIEPWNVKIALRNGGFIAPESALTLPSQPITGPDTTNLEGKEFLVRVKINNKEEARIRVRIYHIATEKMNRIPLPDNHWLRRAEPIFPEEAEVLAELNDKDKKLIMSDDD